MPFARSGGAGEVDLTAVQSHTKRCISPHSANTMNRQQQTEIEAAVFRKMIAHLQQYPEVQNIDLMNLAYFCRNCFSRWYRSAAQQHGVELDDDRVREIIYGMPYPAYKAQHQEQADAAQLAALADSQRKATE